VIPIYSVLPLKWVTGRYILTEDLRENQNLGNVKVINPYVTGRPYPLDAARILEGLNSLKLQGSPERKIPHTSF
jgi:hypothetical protein